MCVEVFLYGLCTRARCRDSLTEVGACFGATFEGAREGVPVDWVAKIRDGKSILENARRPRG